MGGEAYAYDAHGKVVPVEPASNTTIEASNSTEVDSNDAVDEGDATAAANSLSGEGDAETAQSPGMDSNKEICSLRLFHSKPFVL